MEDERRREVPDTWEKLYRNERKTPKVRQPMKITKWFADEPGAGDSELIIRQPDGRK